FPQCRRLPALDQSQGLHDDIRRNAVDRAGLVVRTELARPPVLLERFVVDGNILTFDSGRAEKGDPSEQRNRTQIAGDSHGILRRSTNGKRMNFKRARRKGCRSSSSVAWVAR